MFTIHCTIRDTVFPKVMLDLDALINVIPYSLHKSLKLGNLPETGVVIQLADRSNVYPRGKFEYVLRSVNCNFLLIFMSYTWNLISVPPHPSF